MDQVKCYYSKSYAPHAAVVVMEFGCVNEHLHRHPFCVQDASRDARRVLDGQLLCTKCLTRGAESPLFLFSVEHENEVLKVQPRNPDWGEIRRVVIQGSLALLGP